MDRHRLAARVTLVQGDLFEPVAGRYDLILCNPPYVCEARLAALPAEFRKEPALALRGGADGLDIVRAVLRRAADYLEPGGALIMETGSASPRLEQVCPAVPFTWLATAGDAMAVLLLSRDDLRQAAAARQL